MPTGATSTPEGSPILTLNGDNPATVNVGATYADLGANITGPTTDLNLGLSTLLDGATTTSLLLDTSKAGTHTIEYRAFDQNGLMGSASRTVIVSTPANDNQATTTAATSTATN
jgi:hypothetical protein